MAVPAYQSISFANRSSGSQSNAQISVDKPPGTVNGDLMLAACTSRAQGGPITVVVPVDWTKETETSNANTIHLAMCWKVAGVAEPNSYTFQFNGTSFSGMVHVVRISGADLVDPVDIADDSVGNSNRPIAPAVVTAVANTLVYRVASVYRDPSITPVNVAVNRWDRLSNGSATDRHISSGDEQEFTIAGDVSTFEWSTGNSRPWVTSTIAIKPGTGPEPTVPFIYNHYYRNLLAGRSAPG